MWAIYSSVSFDMHKKRKSPEELTPHKATDMREESLNELRLNQAATYFALYDGTTRPKSRYIYRGNSNGEAYNADVQVQ